MTLWKIPIPAELLSERLHFLRRPEVAVAYVDFTQIHPYYNPITASSFSVEGRFSIRSGSGETGAGQQ